MPERASTITTADILNWADAYHARVVCWPNQRSGQIAPGLTWATVNQALRLGYRGLPGGSSLAALLRSARGVQSWRGARLTIDDILAWADAYHAVHQRWPSARSGRIAETVALTWGAVEKALVDGRHGFSGGSSIARLLRDCRGTRSAREHDSLSEAQILVWADAYWSRLGRWPTRRSGPVAGASGVTWAVIDRALRVGRHGLVGSSSLRQLLEKEPGTRRRIRTVPTAKQRRIIKEIRKLASAVKRPSRRKRVDRSVVT